MLLRSPRVETRGRPVLPAEPSHLFLTFIAPSGLGPRTRTPVRLLGPCFKTGRWTPVGQLPPRSPRAFAGATRRAATQAAFPRGERRPFGRLGRLSPSPPLGRPLSRGVAVAIASSSTVSSLLTLFSKFFSSFLHSTCALSASHRYLALEEAYLPLELQSQGARLCAARSDFGLPAARGSHPLRRPVPEELLRSDLAALATRDYNSLSKTEISSVGDRKSVV